MEGGRRVVPYDRLVSLGVAGAVLLCLAQSIGVIRTEQAVAPLIRQLGVLSLLAERNYPLSGPSLLQAGTDSLPPRGLLSSANMKVLAAGAENDPVLRSRLLDAARTDALQATATRPIWGEAWTMVAFSTAQRRGERDAETRKAFERSYADAPYQRNAGAWRVAYAFRNWSDLSPETRSRSVAEAVWIARIDKSLRDRVFAMARQSDAFVPLLTEWRRSRLGDADYRNRAGSAP